MITFIPTLPLVVILICATILAPLLRPQIFMEIVIALVWPVCYVSWSVYYIGIWSLWLSYFIITTTYWVGHGFLSYSVLAIMNFPEFVLETTHFVTFVIPRVCHGWYDYIDTNVFQFSPVEYISSLMCKPPQTFLFFWTMPQTRYCELSNYFNGVSHEISDFDINLVVAIFCACVMYWTFMSGLGVRIVFREYLMKLIVPAATTPHLLPENIRSAFNALDMAPIRSANNHTHGDAAADRSTASAFIDRLGPNLGLTPYFVQRSRADERKSRMGSRVPFWTKDLTVDLEAFDPPAYSLLAFVDVDQYVDMPSFMCNNFAPIIVYTFQPSQVARMTDNYSFTFNSDDEVLYRVTGGALYQHKVWNYGVDNVLVSKTFLGIPYALAAYLVDRRCTSDDHELILLTPVSMWTGLWSIAAWITLSGINLARLSVAQGRFLRLMVSSKEGLKVSTGKVAEHAQALVPVDVDDTIATIAATSKYDLTMPQVTSFTDGDRIAGALLLDFHRSRVPRKSDVVCPVPDSIRRYQFEPRNYDPEMKSAVVPFMSPLLGDCFVPDLGIAAEREAVHARITSVAPPTLTLTPQLSGWIDEFIAFLIPVAHQCDPVDVDYLYDQQDRPTQRRILDAAQFLLPNSIAQCFIKKETYGKLAPPRIITQINASDKEAYSKYMYTFAEVLKNHNWYAFGKTPLMVAQRVAEIAMSAKVCTANSDFKRFDGHGSNIMRDLERRTLLRAFRHEHHNQLCELHRSQYGLRAFTTNGIEYETLYARASGSPETSSFNGVTNAFVSYIEARIRHMEPQDAWDGLGIYGGDDGLTADVGIDSYTRAAQMIGQEIEVELTPVGSLGVMFLSRVYGPHVWYGDATSCCDLPRQLTKLHTTVCLTRDVTPIDKLVEKSRAYWLTDEHTPILGPFVSKVIALYGSMPSPTAATANMRAWGSLVSKESQYPNCEADWMHDYVETVLPNLDAISFWKWFNSVTCLNDMLSPPLLQEPCVAKPTVPVVLDGEVLPYPPTKTSFTAGKPPNERTPEEFLEWKTKRQAEGKWVDRSKPGFDEWKAKLVAKGKWVDKPARVSSEKDKQHKTPRITTKDKRSTTTTTPAPRPVAVVIE